MQTLDEIFGKYIPAPLQPVAQPQKPQQPIFQQLTQTQPMSNEEWLALFDKPAQPVIQQQVQNDPYTFTERVGDVVDNIQGVGYDVLSSIGGLLFEQNDPRLQYLKDRSRINDMEMSDNWHATEQENARKLAEAKARGETGFVQTLSNAWQNPFHALVQTGRSVAPTVVAGALTGGIGAGAVGAVQAAGSAKNAIFDEISQLNENQLAHNDTYRALRQQGLSHEQARYELANSWTEHAGELAAIAGTSFALEKLGGFGKGLLGGAGKTIHPAKSFIREVASETAEETAQQALQNKAVQDFDQQKSLMDDVGESAAMGLIGGALGGGVSSAQNAYLNYMAKQNSAENSSQAESTETNTQDPSTEQATEQPVEQPQADISTPQGMADHIASTQTQDRMATQTPVELNAQVVDEILAPYADDESTKQDLHDQLQSDIATGQIYQQAQRQTKLGKLYRQYLDKTEPKWQENLQASSTPNSSLAQVKPDNGSLRYTLGKNDEVDLGDNDYQPFTYALVEADEIGATKHKSDNQYRDRNRMASNAQVTHIARNLDPRKLVGSPTMDMGAPIITKESNDIVAGNGRTMAIRQAYQENKADGYRQHLVNNAKTYGFTPDQVQKFKRPMLVRKLNNSVDVQQVAIRSNEQGGLRMSALEQAKVDASRLPNLDLLDETPIESYSNRNFVTAFLRNVPNNLINDYIDSKGNLSKTGVERLRNAVLYKAYGDTDTLAQSAETNDGSKNILNAMVAVANKVAKTKSGIMNGEVDANADISQDMVRAVDVFNQARSQGKHIDEYLLQQDFISELSPVTKALIRLFAQNARSSQRIVRALNQYFTAVDTKANLAQTSMFGDESFNSVTEIQNAVETETNDIQTNAQDPSAEQEKNNRLSVKDPRQKEQRGIYNVTYNDKKSTIIRQDLETVENAIKYEKGKGDKTLPNGYVKNGFGALHIEKHLDPNKDGYVTTEELLKMGDIVRSVEPYESRGNRVYETYDKNGTRFRVVVTDRDNGKVITFYSNRRAMTANGGRSPLGANYFNPNAESYINSAVDGANNKPNLDKRKEKIARKKVAREFLEKSIGKQNANRVIFVDENTQIPQGESIESLTEQGVEGWFNIRTGKIYVNLDGIKATDTLTADERLAWVAFHELGHRGFHVKYGKEYRSTLEHARTHPVVRTLARRIQKERNEPNLDIATEEAIAELHAAFKTGNWAALKETYGIEPHHSWKSDSKAKRFIDAIVRIIQRIMQRITGNNTLTNGDVLAILRNIDAANANDTAGKLRPENGDERYFKAYHGSPHSFNKFSTDYMGAGEGAQLYGWGLYFTDKASIAKRYANKGVQVNVDGDVFISPQKPFVHTPKDFDAFSDEKKIAYNLIEEFSGDKQAAFDYLQRNADEALIGKVAPILEKLNVEVKGNRNLYEVKIHGDKTVDELNFMRWDLPLPTAQKETIRRNIKKSLKDETDLTAKMYLNQALEVMKRNGRAEGVYYQLTNAFDSQQKASEFLLNAGIDGIQYPAEHRSDNSDKGSYNYVVFDDNAVAIDDHIRYSLNTPNSQLEDVRKQYENTDQWLKAPNGKPTKLTENQWLQVRTPNFKKWFGDWENDPKNASKVVDENGEPMVVYHGTKKAGFTEFDGNFAGSNSNNVRNGFYFSDDPMRAKTYSGTEAAAELIDLEQPIVSNTLQSDIENLPDGESTTFTIDVGADEFTVTITNNGDDEYYTEIEDSNGYYPVEESFDKDELFDALLSEFIDIDDYTDRGNYAVFLNIREPYEYDFDGANWDGYKEEDDDFYGESMPAVEQDAYEMGADGVIAYNLTDDGGEYDTYDLANNYVAFNPNQIKSATDNTGEFSAGSDDIRYSLNRPKSQSLEKLRRSKDVEITGKEIDLTGDWKSDKAKALAYGKKLANKAYLNRDTGNEIALNVTGVKEALQHDYKNKEHLQSIAAIPQMIENAIYVGTLPNEDGKRPDIRAFDYYLVGLNIGGEKHTARLVVGQSHYGEKYYDHKLSNIEKGDLTRIIRTDNKSGGSVKSPLTELKDKRLAQILQADNDKIRFSKRAKVSEPYKRDLMVTHNISADSILHADKMGGLPLASVAVTKQNNPLTGFGEVTLIGDRNYIDPKGANKAKVFGSDIYSPRYPAVHYEVRDKDVKSLQHKFNLGNDIGVNVDSEINHNRIADDGLFETLSRSKATQYQFVKDNNIDFDIAYKEVERPTPKSKVLINAASSGKDLMDLLHNQAFRKKFADERIAQNDEVIARTGGLIARKAKIQNHHLALSLQGENYLLDNLIRQEFQAYENSLIKADKVFDRYETHKKLQQLINQNKQDFDSYINNVIKDMPVKEKLFDGHTNDGQSKFVAHTLSNVVKKLKKDLRGGESFNYGLPSLRAKVTPQFKSIDEIQKAKGKLLPKDVFEAVKQQAELEFEKLQEQLGVDYQQASNILFNTIEEGVQKAFMYEDIEDTPAKRKAIATFLAYLKEMPTEYFEAKAKDITQFSDFVGAVIPNNLMSKARQVLENAGLVIYEYNPDDENSRADVIAKATNELDEQHDREVLFSKRQSVADLAKTGKAKADLTWFDDVKTKGGFKRAWNKFTGFVDTNIGDAQRPVLDWLDDVASKVKGADSQAYAERMKGDLQRAKGVRDALIVNVEKAYLKPLLKNIATVAKKYKMDELTAKRLVGYWASVRYSIEKNTQMLEAKKRALKEAEQALAEIETTFEKEKQAGKISEETQQAYDDAHLAQRKAERDYQNFKHDVTLKGDGKFKVGVAGGWSIPQAGELLKQLEKHISAADYEKAVKPLYALNQARLKMDYKNGRYTPEQYAIYKQNPHYVPLTGDPNGGDVDDIITGVEGVNPSKDHALKGRKNSEAEDSIDASWRQIANTATYQGFFDFKQDIDDLYENELARLKADGQTEVAAKREIETTLGISKSRLKGTTRANDDVLIRKAGGVYYEYRLPRKVIQAMKGANVERTNSVLEKVIGNPTRLFARGVTQWNLGFAPVNMVRDVWEKSELIRTMKLFHEDGTAFTAKERNKVARAMLGYVFEPSTWKTSTRYGVDGDLTKTPTGKALKDLLDLGGVSTWRTFLSRDEQDLVKKIKRQNSRIGKRFEQAGNIIEGWNKSFDIVSSLALYRALLDSGMSDKQAAALTLDTTNFRKTGAVMRPIKALFMFSQPAAMGGANLARQLSTKQGMVRFASYTVAMMALFAMLMAMVDDDELESVDMTRYIPIPTPSGDVVKIPVGYGMPMLAWNWAQNIIRFAKGNITATDAAVNMAQQVVASGTPISPSNISAAQHPVEKLADTLSPTLVKPLVQFGMNMNAFGTPIHTKWDVPNKAKADQAKPTTAPFWTDVATTLLDDFGLDTYPENIQHFMRSYGGYFGSVSDVLNAAIENPNKESLGLPTRTPIFNSLYGTTGKAYVVQSRYYDATETAQSLANRVKSELNRGIKPTLTPLERQELRWQKGNEQVTKRLRSAKAKLTRAFNQGKLSQQEYRNALTAHRKQQLIYFKKLLNTWREMHDLSTYN